MAGINQQAEAQKSEATQKQQDINTKAAAAEVDPLEAFMSGIHSELKQSKSKSKQQVGGFVPERMDNDDGFDEMKAQLAAQRESGGRLSQDASAREMLRAEKQAEMQARNRHGKQGGIEYDDDGNEIVHDAKFVPTLAPLDHATIKYEPFQKEFYRATPSVTSQPQSAIVEFRKRHVIKVTGGGGAGSAIRPINSFAQAGFDALLSRKIASVGFVLLQCDYISPSHLFLRLEIW